MVQETVILYFNGLDNSLGKIFFGNISPCAMIFLSFSIWSYLFVNTELYKANVSTSQKQSHNKQHITKFQSIVSKKAFFTGVVVFFYALKILFSDLVNKVVYDMLVEKTSNNYFQQNSTAKNFVPSRCLWAVASVFAGSTSAFFLVLSYSTISTEFRRQNVSDHSTLGAAVDEIQSRLAVTKTPSKLIFYVTKPTKKNIKTIKSVFICLSLIMFVVVFTFEATSLLIFVAKKNYKFEISQFKISSDSVNKIYTFLDTSNLWLLDIPELSILFATFLNAIISTCVLVISYKSKSINCSETPKFLVAYKRTMKVQTVGSWLFLIGPLLRMTVQPSVSNFLNVDFKQNFFYNLVIAVASILTSCSALYIQVLSTKMCGLNKRENNVRCLYIATTSPFI